MGSCTEESENILKYHSRSEKILATATIVRQTKLKKHNPIIGLSK